MMNPAISSIGAEDTPTGDQCYTTLDILFYIAVIIVVVLEVRHVCRRAPGKFTFRIIKNSEKNSEKGGENAEDDVNDLEKYEDKEDLIRL